jgi:hypothetical protein
VLSTTAIKGIDQANVFKRITNLSIIVEVVLSSLKLDVSREKKVKVVILIQGEVVRA